jgi:hypothetical protein
MWTIKNKRILFMKVIHVLEMSISLTVFCTKECLCWAAMVYASNPSYSGGRDQEDHGSKPALANSLQDPLLKKPFTKKGWWSGSR